MASIDSLVALLEKANDAYRNTDTLLMSDEEYDERLEELRKMSPKHPFLAKLGSKGSILLPYTMASLNKIRFGEGLMKKWVAASASETNKFVISDKLDGISALYVVDNDGKETLYLRGDGVKGVDVTSMLSKTNLKKPGFPCIVRGELVLPKASIPEGSIGRSLINGWMHTTKACSTVIHFLAYQVLEPKVATRGLEFLWLGKYFSVPWNRLVGVHTLEESVLKDVLIERRNDGLYPIDGIVVSAASSPASLSIKGQTEAINPKDSIAFKASLEDQKQTTTVISVEWNASRHGTLVPRIQIEPVVIGAAKIQWLSGHNAALIHKNGIGVGARITVRRSGDVIPTLDAVLTPCLVPSLPPAEPKWKWDENKTNIVLEEMHGESLHHAFQTLEVDGMGPGLAAKLEEGGIDTMKKVWDATPATLSGLIGGVRAENLVKNLRESVKKATMSQLLIASNCLGKGVGERKLKGFFLVEADPKKWTFDLLSGVAGWSHESLREFLEVLPSALAWISKSFPAASSEAKKEAKSTDKQIVVFSGVRDKVLEVAIGDSWEVDPNVTKKTKVVVVADQQVEGQETTKVKKARDLGIRIMTLSEFRSFSKPGSS